MYHEVGRAVHVVLNDISRRRALYVPCISKKEEITDSATYEICSIRYFLYFTSDQQNAPSCGRG